MKVLAAAKKSIIRYHGEERGGVSRGQRAGGGTRHVIETAGKKRQKNEQETDTLRG